MPLKPSHYEASLAEYSDRDAVLELLRQFRPYLEMVPSMRRPHESLISVPLPLVQVRIEERRGDLTTHRIRQEVVALPCDIGILMCDPEWKIKTGVEICVFIHRPGEDFSDFLGRWRQTQILLSQNYEWILPPRFRHLLSDGADDILPLFVVFEQTPERILRGLNGAYLPYVVKQPKPELVEADASVHALYQGGEAIEFGLAEPGLAQPELAQPGLAQPELADPGLADSGLMQPGLIQSGLTEPEIKGQNGMDLEPPGHSELGFDQLDV